MSTTMQVLAQIREDRAKREAEGARWARRRTDANPPAWFTVATAMTAFGGTLVLVEYLLKHPDAIRNPLGMLIVPCAALIGFAFRLSRRRERVVVRILEEEAPELFEKLKSERIIR